MIKMNLSLEVFDYTESEEIGNLVASLFKNTKSGHGLTVEFSDSRTFVAQIMGYSIILTDKAES